MAYKHSEETRKKISQNHRRKNSEESKKKISQTLKGRKINWGDKISKALKGIKKSKEHRNNLKKSKNAGKKNYWFGKKREGKDNPNWKGGITPLFQIIRTSNQYQKWRSDIFERDNWTCQTCQKRGVYLEAHHIKEFSKILRENEVNNFQKAIKCEELWSLDNGVALCEDCHKLTRFKK